MLVLGIIAVSVRNQMHASRALLSGPTAEASAPFGGTSSPNVAQFQRELDKALRDSAAHTANATASADADADATR